MLAIEKELSWLFLDSVSTRKGTSETCVEFHVSFFASPFRVHIEMAINQLLLQGSLRAAIVT